MNLTLFESHINQSDVIRISGSKSESNRLLLLKALYPNLQIDNLSNADDTVVMEKALQGESEVVDVHHAGTAMRFLTAFFAIQPNSVVTLTGSHRMLERPIGILVDALNKLGADITYLGKNGFPPIRVNGHKLSKKEIKIQADISSQYISALMLIAPKLPNGLNITLDGIISSRPYIEMTLSLLNKIGVKTTFNQNVIQIESLETISTALITVESDWSSASYYYSLVALSDIGTKIIMSSFRENSIQGDAELKDIYKGFGVRTLFYKDNLVLEKIQNVSKSHFEFDLVKTPDIAQTIAVTCFGLGVSCLLNGLHTLKIKETDRLLALQTELVKFGAKVQIDENSLYLNESKTIKKNVEVSTYNDHRMAMAFAPLCLKTELIIQDANVVSKSYPNFWNDLKRLGIKVS